MLKKKKLLSFVLSATMLLNLLSGCNVKKEKNVENTSVLAESSVDDDTFELNYGRRNYTFDSNGVVMSFIKYEYTSELDVQDWIKYDLCCDPYNDKIEYPEKFIGYNWAEAEEEVKIRIPKEAYGYGNNIGIFISEDLGNIDWNKISMVSDFVYINCMDFKDDSYDSKFEEAVKICDEKGIPYGLVFTADMNQFEDPTVGMYDSETVKKILRKYNESLPTILKIEEKEIPEDLKNDSLSYGIYDFINGEDNYKGLSNSKQYLINFFNNFSLSSNVCFIQADSKTLFNIEKFEKEYYFLDENKTLLGNKLLDDMLICSNYNFNDENAILGYYDNIYRDSDNEYEITNYIVTDKYDESFLNISETVRKEYIKMCGGFVAAYGLILLGSAFCKKIKGNIRGKGYSKKK